VAQAVAAIRKFETGSCLQPAEDSEFEHVC
jgi:hypothetical protein